MTSLASLARAWRAAFAIGILAGGFALVAPAVTASAGLSGGNYFVSMTGTDTGTCQTLATACATINYAIGQATPNAVINVAKGLYNQQVNVDKNVTIDGAVHQGTVIQPTSLVANGVDPDHPTIPIDAIIAVNVGNDASLRNIVVNGAAVANQFEATGCATNFVGVYYHDASGGLTSVVANNIAMPSNLFGCQDGLGIYAASDPGSTSIVTMSQVVVTNYQKNGITCDDAGTSCVINSSTVIGVGPSAQIAQNGIQGYNATYLRIANSKVKDASYTLGGANNQATGLLIYDVGAVEVVGNAIQNNDVNVFLGSDGTGPVETKWNVRDNRITNATDNVAGGEALYGDGIQIDSTNNNIVLDQNLIKFSAENGISLLGASHVKVAYNMSYSNTGNGIYIGGPGSVVTGGSSHNLIEHNDANGNGQDGILADADSTLNAFEANIADANAKFDLQDLGVDNGWAGNTCNPQHDSSPAHLC
jgi:hypothetical protein